MNGCRKSARIISEVDVVVLWQQPVYPVENGQPAVPRVKTPIFIVTSSYIRRLPSGARGHKGLQGLQGFDDQVSSLEALRFLASLQSLSPLCPLSPFRPHQPLLR
jgi:hypothetical protein